MYNKVVVHCWLLYATHAHMNSIIFVVWWWMGARVGFQSLWVFFSLSLPLSLILPMLYCALLLKRNGSQIRPHQISNRTHTRTHLRCISLALLTGKNEWHRPHTVHNPISISDTTNQIYDALLGTTSDRVNVLCSISLIGASSAGQVRHPPSHRFDGIWRGAHFLSYILSNVRMCKRTVWWPPKIRFHMVNFPSWKPSLIALHFKRTWSMSKAIGLVSIFTQPSWVPTCRCADSVFCHEFPLLASNSC